MPVLKNTKHEAFAQKVAQGVSETQAYAQVYGRDAEAGSTRGNASRLRSNEIVAARIAELQSEAAEQAVVTTREILLELKKLGFSDVRGLFREDGTMKHPTEWPDDIAGAVASFEIVEEFEGSGRDRMQIGYLKKVKFWDKNKALELMGRNTGGFKEQVEHSGTVTLEDLVLGSFEKKQ